MDKYRVLRNMKEEVGNLPMCNNPVTIVKPKTDNPQNNHSTSCKYDGWTLKML